MIYWIGEDLHTFYLIEDVPDRTGRADVVGQRRKPEWCKKGDSNWSGTRVGWPRNSLDSLTDKKELTKEEAAMLLFEMG